jgi:hypothetical protein
MPTLGFGFIYQFIRIRFIRLLLFSASVSGGTVIRVSQWPVAGVELLLNDKAKIPRMSSSAYPCNHRKSTGRLQNDENHYYAFQNTFLKISHGFLAENGLDPVLNFNSL